MTDSEPIQYNTHTVPGTNITIINPSDSNIEEKSKSVIQASIAKLNESIYTGPAPYSYIVDSGYRFLTQIGSQPFPIYNGLGIHKEFNSFYEPQFDSFKVTFKYYYHCKPSVWATNVSASVINDSGISSSEPEIIAKFVMPFFARYLAELMGIHNYQYLMDPLLDFLKVKPSYSTDTFIDDEIKTITTGPAWQPGKSISALSKTLPGVDVLVHCPCGEKSCGYCLNKTKSSMWAIVQYLNDRVKWSREKIADWMDELHDTGQVNIEFDSWGEGEEPEGIEKVDLNAPPKPGLPIGGSGNIYWSSSSMKASKLKIDWDLVGGETEGWKNGGVVSEIFAPKLSALDKANLEKAWEKFFIEKEEKDDKD